TGLRIPIDERGDVDVTEHSVAQSVDFPWRCAEPSAHRHSAGGAAASSQEGSTVPELGIPVHSLRLWRWGYVPCAPTDSRVDNLSGALVCGSVSPRLRRHGKNATHARPECFVPVHLHFPSFSSGCHTLLY